MAETFADALFRLTCTRLARDAAIYAAQGETGRHPSWHAVDEVLEGIRVVSIARNGYLRVVEKN